MYLALYNARARVESMGGRQRTSLFITKEETKAAAKQARQQKQQRRGKKR